MHQRNPLTVSINWPTMFYACMDCYCACGEHFHVDVYDGQKQSPEHVRCPECKAVYRVGSETLLVTGELNYDRLNHTTHAFVQWKGTELHGTAHCSCGHDDSINRDFAYDHTCTACKAEYKVDCHVELHRLTDADIAALPAGAVVEPEKEETYEDEVAAPQPTPSEPLVLGTADRVLILPDIHTPAGLGRLPFEGHVFERFMRNAPSVMVVTADGVSDLLVEGNADLHDLFAISRYPDKPSK